MALVTTWAHDALLELERAGLRRELDPLGSPQGPTVTLASGERLVNFSSNDYLGLAHDSALSEVVADGARRFGVGAGASRLIVGDLEPHQRLELEAAKCFGTEAALAFTSGWAANVGLVTALVGPGDAVFSDALNHASLIDGCRLSRADVFVYPHGDTEALERQLEQCQSKKKLVVTDSIFSMDGDVAPLRKLQVVCARQGAALHVDEAHALGVLGPTGGGACEALGVVPDSRLGTLSKAAGGQGAFIAGSTALRELLINKSRSFVFSTGLSPALAWHGAHALRRIRDDAPLRNRLWLNVETFAAGLRLMGFDIAPRSAIFPIVLGAPEAAVAAAATLRRRGVLAKAIRPPTVPEGKACLRFTVTASHTEAHLHAALGALAEGGLR